MVGRIYKEDHYKLLHTKYESSGPCYFAEEYFFMFFFPRRPRGWACMDPRGTVGRIYKEEHYTLLYTKYISAGPCGFGEDFFLYFSNCKSMGVNNPRGGATFDPMGMIHRIYVFPMTPPGRGLYGPQGHAWQDL